MRTNYNSYGFENKFMNGPDGDTEYGKKDAVLAVLLFAAFVAYVIHVVRTHT